MALLAIGLLAAATLLACGTAAVFAAPAHAQRHSRSLPDVEWTMSWTTGDVTPFKSPRTAPGQRTPSIDGSLVACVVGNAAATPTAAGLDVRFTVLEGPSGRWGGPGDQSQPSVSDGLIAGLDQSRVAVFDPATAASVAVSDVGAEPLAPDFAGDVIVWQDHRSGGWDIYARRFDRATQQPVGDAFPVCTAAGEQSDPAVDDGVVVWQDHRGASWDIYSCDLSTMMESPVCVAAGDQLHPDVCAQNVVWQDSRRGQWRIYGYDISTATEAAIGDVWGRQTNPAVSDELVVYEQRERNGDAAGRAYFPPKIQAYSIAARETLEQLSNRDIEAPAESHPAVSGSIALWENYTRRLPAGCSHVIGAKVSNLWAYSWETSLKTIYVNRPELTFDLAWWVCPTPPVTEVGFVVGEAEFSGRIAWQPFAPQVTVPLPGGDGLKYYGISFKDSAGKDNGGEGSYVILDTHGPACRTPTPMSVSEGGTALLRYKVTDRLSRDAKVRIAILREDGSEVRPVLPVRWVETGVMKTRRIDCDLIPGRYQVRVTATDAAGNEQSRAGTTTLTVR
jgi:beta propeller repeat protein